MSVTLRFLESSKALYQKHLILFTEEANLV
jgi:hypothetical protein